MLSSDAVDSDSGGLLRGVLQFRQSVHEWASAEAAPFYRWAAPSSELVDALRELDEMTWGR